MKVQKLRHLEHFFRCQFYEDWFEEYGNEAQACRDFTAHTGPREIEAVIDDINQLLEQAKDEPDLTERLLSLGAMVDFSGGATNSPEWLQNIRNLLKQELIRRTSPLDNAPNPFERLIYAIVNLLPHPTPLDILTFDFVMEYFIANRTEVPRAVRGAVLRQQHPLGILVIQVFLDEQGNVVLKTDNSPYGRRLLAARLDEELKAHFDNRDLLIVE